MEERLFIISRKTETIFVQVRLIIIHNKFLKKEDAIVFCLCEFGDYRDHFAVSGAIVSCI